MKKLFITLSLLFMLTSCASMYTAKTTVHVKVTPDGTCQADYTSDKEQEGLKASVCGGSVEVAKSGTLESVVAAVAANQAALAKMLDGLTSQLSTMIPAAAKAGALAGS